MIPTTLGGIGIFLLGMILMTEGLRTAAGDALRGILSRFTGGRITALFSGVAMTALVQSSSATTLATIGFVSAGLLTFTQAVGVIFGANLGTTSTGWIVSIIGLKLDISAIALPLVGVGALMRLMLRGRGSALGLALAGFGLIFVGIDILQKGMEGFAEQIDLTRITGETVVARLLLVLVGVVMTFVTQSSSAALATTLTAVHSGAIGLVPAAALVIGQNVGTTLTAALASVGASIPARRTALAHVLFNLVTGIVAFVGLPLFLRMASMLVHEDQAATLAAFHTLFNVAGVILLLPVVGPFAEIVKRIIPEKERMLTRHLDSSVADVGPVAVEAARRTVDDVAAVVFRGLERLLTRGGGADPGEEFEEVTEALQETRRFLARVESSRDAPREYARHLAVLHAIDHLERLAEAGREEGLSEVIRDDESLTDAVQRLLVVVGFQPGVDDTGRVAEIARIAAELGKIRLVHRRETLEITALGRISPLVGTRRLDGMQWIERVAYHAWRAAHHLSSQSLTDDHPEVYFEADVPSAE